MLAGLLEMFIYGFYVSIFWSSLTTLVQRRKHGSQVWFHCVNRILLSGNVALFLAVTAHVTITIIRLCTIFLNHDELPSVSFLIITDGRQVARFTLTLFIVLVFDSLLIYRVHMICDNVFFLIPLVALCSADFAASVLFVQGILSGKPNAWKFWKTWFATVMGLSFCLNALSVAFIAYTVFGRNRAFPWRTFSSSSRVLAIVIEGGILYWITTLVNLGTILGGTSGSCITLDTTAPIVGISLCLMCTRVAQGRSPSTRGVSAVVAAAIPLQISVHQEQSTATSASEQIRTKKKQHQLKAQEVGLADERWV